MTLPVAYEIIRKPIVFEDENTGRLKRRSEVSKNELMRRMLKVCQQNRLEYRMFWQTVGFRPKRT